MKTFLDTNVVVAACLEDHEHHERALELLERVLSGKDAGFTSAHALAEAYAVMTRLPKPLRVSPQAAATLLEENFVERFEVVTLTAREYGTLITGAGQAGWVGGILYDALHVACAVKAKVERLYSWNVRHLQTVAPEAFRTRLVVP
jgi:predicted nucleic acid-binding protein